MGEIPTTARNEYETVEKGGRGVREMRIKIWKAGERGANRGKGTEAGAWERIGKRKNAKSSVASRAEGMREERILTVREKFNLLLPPAWESSRA